MDKERVLKLIERACAQAGSQVAWAKAHGISAAYVSDVLQGRREPGAKILDAVGIERVVVYRKVQVERRGKRDDE